MQFPDWTAILGGSLQERGFFFLKPLSPGTAQLSVGCWSVFSNQLAERYRKSLEGLAVAFTTYWPQVNHMAWEELVYPHACCRFCLRTCMALWSETWPLDPECDFKFWQQTHEKMLKLTSHQRSASHMHTKISSHTCHNGHH